MIETKSATITKVNENTVKVVFKLNAKLFHQEYITYDGHYKTLLGDIKGIKYLVVMQEGFKLGDKYLTFFKKKYRTDNKIAEAHVIVDPNQRMFFRLGLKLVKRKYPVKLFTNEKEALEWLEVISA